MLCWDAGIVIIAVVRRGGTWTGFGSSTTATPSRLGRATTSVVEIAARMNAAIGLI